MKTVEKLVAEMQATSKELEHARKTDAKLAKRLAKELVWLRGLLVYLETQQFAGMRFNLDIMRRGAALRGAPFFYSQWP